VPSLCPLASGHRALQPAKHGSSRVTRPYCQVTRLATKCPRG
jgi:hypothetical protein